MLFLSPIVYKLLTSVFFYFSYFIYLSQGQRYFKIKKYQEELDSFSLSDLDSLVKSRGVIVSDIGCKDTATAAFNPHLSQPPQKCPRLESSNPIEAPDPSPSVSSVPPANKPKASSESVVPISHQSTKPVGEVPSLIGNAKIEIKDIDSEDSDDIFAEVIPRVRNLFFFN